MKLTDKEISSMFCSITGSQIQLLAEKDCGQRLSMVSVI